MKWFVLVLLGAIWGASYLFIKVGGAEIPAFTFVAGRTIIASIALFGVMLARREVMPRFALRTWAPLIAMGIFNSLIPYTLITWGETEISSGLAGILTAMMPIFTVLIAHFVTQDEKLNGYKIAGIVAGFAGVVVLFLPDLQTGIKMSFFGELAVVLAALSYGLSSVIAHKYIHGTPHITAAFGQLFSASVFLLPLSLLVDRPFGLHPSPAALASLATLALLGTAFAYLLYYWLIDRTGATSTSLVTFIIPVSAVVLGAAVLHEHFDWTAFLGLLGIIAGVGLVTRQSDSPNVVPVGVEAE
jgi:drug/metabolite transporter (DMT)-like permease